jgi:hypothetical protein
MITLLPVPAKPTNITETPFFTSASSQNDKRTVSLVGINCD